MTIKIDISEQDIKNILAKYISEQIGNPVDATKICIEVKSKQNFKSEWERADFKAQYISST